MYQKSVELFKKHCYQEALIGFGQTIEQSQSTDDIVSAYYYSLSIYRQLNLTSEWKHLFSNFIGYLHQRRHFLQICEELHELERREKEIPLKLLKYAWSAGLEAGEINWAKKQAIVLLDYYLSQKNFSRGIELIDEWKKKIKLDKELGVRLAECYLLQGNGEQACKVIEELFLQRIMRKSDVKIFAQKFPLEHLQKLNYVTSHFYLMSIISNYVMSAIHSVSERKSLINNLYTAMLFYPTNPEFLGKVIEYARKFGRKRMFETAAQQLRVSAGADKRVQKWIKQNATLIANELSFVDDEIFTVEADVVDMATDLFSVDDHDKKNIAEGNLRMERAIKFLQEIGEESQVAKIQEVPLASEQQVSFVKQSNNLTAVENELRHLMRQFQSKLHIPIESELNDELFKSDELLARYIEKGGVSLDVTNYRDITVSLLELEFTKAAEAVVRNCPLKQDASLDEKLGLVYLKVEVYRRSKKFGDAISLLKEVVETWPLSVSELVCFNYLLGEVYRENGVLERARYHYQIVYQHDAHYRLVEKRLVEID